MDQNVLTATDLSVLHDAELTLVAMEREQSELRLGFKAVDQRVQILSFRGLLTFRIDSVLLQNVVSRVLRSGVDIGSDGELERLVRWTCGEGSGNLLLAEQQFYCHLAKVRAGELRLLYVEPSWGAEIGVLAEGFDLSDG